jgi:hypothetical protein
MAARPISGRKRKLKACEWKYVNGVSNLERPNCMLRIVASSEATMHEPEV